MNLQALLLIPAMTFIKEVCFEPKDEGTCHKYSTRFHYNHATGFCEEFSYGGCGGNRNNFRTEEECQQACTDIYPDRPKECSSPVLSGNCGEALQRYYFNVATGKCEMFIYGGCDGNFNNFPTQESCERRCLQSIPEEFKMSMCHPKPDPGPCMAELIRFFYNPTTETCDSFIYGGCGGNTNNFNDRKTCLSTCSKTRTIEAE